LSGRLIRTCYHSSKKTSVGSSYFNQRKEVRKAQKENVHKWKKQRLYLKENESYSSPTVSLEGLLASLVIDVVEKRKVAIYDVLGAYLHAKCLMTNKH